MLEELPKEFYDISPLISPQIAVFPGDTRFEINEILSFDKGDNIKLSSIKGTVHLGAHADAPNHYFQKGSAIHQRDLHYYFGKAQVVDIKIQKGERIRKEDIEGLPILAPRILFKTDSFQDPNTWHNHFNSLSPELIHYLAGKSVSLVGIDTPSIDPAKDSVLPSHQAVADNDMAILEGLLLKDVPEGIYTLIALPLKIQCADASPVRAILLP